MELPLPLYSAAQVRELDRRAIDLHRIPGVDLMTRAGAAAFRVLRVRCPRARRIAVVCGPGNNGGDGYVVARRGREAGLAVTVLAMGDPKAGTDAARARAEAETAGVQVKPFDPAPLGSADVIVDALLGTGLERPIEGKWRAAVEAMNAAGCPILAVDVPSGLQADTGAVMGAAVRAHITVSFIGLKAGLLTADGPDHAGEIVFDDLDVPPDIYHGLTPVACRLSGGSLRGTLARRPRNAHKGSFGHVLVVGGGKGMPGAARLCGEAALRVGAGLVTIATHPSHAAMLNAARPELLVYGVRNARELKPLMARATVVALGPGLSLDPWARALWRSAIAGDVPLVIDADGLNWLAREPTAREQWVLTPHPGEAARLLGTSTDAVQRNRFAAAAALSARFGGVCVLKGAGTLIAAAGDTWLCDRGNPGMASAGAGDVLTGAIAGLRAQKLPARDASRLGVWAHAAAGDDATGPGEAGLLAADIFPFIRRRLNQLIDDDSDPR